MVPNARLVLSVMKRMDELGKVMTIATGHGLLIQPNARELTARYRTWSQTRAKAERNNCCRFFCIRLWI